MLTRLLLTFATAHFALMSAWGQARKGVQPVLLPSWSQGSAERMGNVLAAAKQNPIEIAFWATYREYGTNADGTPDAGFPYAIPKVVIDKLLAAKKQVVVRVYLGTIHATDGQSTTTIQKQVTHLNDDLIDVYAGNSAVTYRISPALEDRFTSKAAFTTQAKAILSNLSSGLLDRLPKEPRAVMIVRSKAKGDDDYPTTLKVAGKTVTVVREFHPDDMAGNQAYSNDGQFVSSGAEKFLTTDKKSASFTDPITLQEFITDGIDSAAAVQLLWRPAYNLYSNTTAGGVVTYWKWPYANNYEKRVDGTTDATGKYGTVTASGDREAAVLKAFLK